VDYELRWFTREWADGSMSEAEYEQVPVDYERHIASLRPKLPASFRLLAEAGGRIVSMHDGRFIDVSQPVDTVGTFIFDIACWDMARGTLHGNVWEYPHLHVRIVYSGADLVSPDWHSLQALARHAETAIFYNEVELGADGRLEHRMLLWPREAPFVAIRFAEVEVVPVRFEGTSVTVIQPTDD
jgi:hypothetical protein